MRNVILVFALTLTMLFEASANTRLQVCPDASNCVSSLASRDRHRIDPLLPRGTPAGIWAGLVEVVAGWPRTRILEKSDVYLRAEVQSRFFRFLDDLEFEINTTSAVIDVRSASRTGQWDLGVNRRRVEAIRKELARRGLVNP